MGGDATVADAIVLDAIVEPDPGVASVWLPSCVGPMKVAHWDSMDALGWGVRRKPGSTTVVQFKFGGGGTSPALAWAQVRIPA